jgi:hypothetical protein
MAFLMNIGFDNSCRLQRRIYYFEYKGVRYKLIQNPSRRWCDVLLTILPGSPSQDEENHAYTTASEFFSALSWENDSRVKVYPIGGAGIPDSFSLRSARWCNRSFPRVPFCGHRVGYDISRIAQIDTEEQRAGLALFREASSCNNDYLSFLFFWQVLEVGSGDAIGWIDKMWRTERGKIVVAREDLLPSLKPLGKSMGDYLYDDCRCAISHINRRPAGKARIRMDSLDDELRISVSLDLVREFARLYIRERLNVRQRMRLVTPHGRGFPVYVSEKQPQLPRRTP